MTNREEVLASVAHELRGPLTAIVACIHLLEREKLGGQARRALEIIHRNAMTQSRLIDDLLDQSRVSRGALRMTREIVDVLALAMEVVDALRPTADERRIEIFVHAEGPATVCADPQRLRQVLLNLLTNALNYSTRGSRVDLEIFRANGRLVIRVRDSGIGIAPAFLPHVFERFRREERSNASGLGLGLTIAREIAELHGGSITAESAGEGHGSTFTLSLPSLDGALRKCG
jgi:signal transduction histidine kinase